MVKTTHNNQSYNLKMKNDSKILSEEIHLEDGRKIIIETGKLAKQADGSVVVKMGKCMLLATVVSSRTPSS